MQFLVLKPWQNKKDQTLVGMLVFGMSFFEFQSAAYCKKRQVKNEHRNKHLVLLILTVVVGYRLHYEKFFIRFCWPDEKITRDVCMNAQFQAKLGHMTTNMAIMHDIYLCKQFHRRIIDKKILSYCIVINESNSFNLKLLSNNFISQLKKSYSLNS